MSVIWAVAAMGAASEKSRRKTGVKQAKMGRFEKGNKHGNKFKAGETGNPNGRPKTKPLTEQLLKRLNAQTPAIGEVRDRDGNTIKIEIPNMERLADALLIQCAAGNVQAIKEAFDRIEGKVTEKHELSDPNGDPITFQTVIKLPEGEIKGVD